MNDYNSYLSHHGIKGQKWGVRRFETSSGHLTAAGKARYNTDGDGEYKKLHYKSSKLEVKAAKDRYKIAKKQYRDSYKRSLKKSSTDEDASSEYSNSQKKLIEAQNEYMSKKESLKNEKAELKAEQEANKKHLTSEQKAKIAITAAVVAAGAITVGTLAYKHKDKINAGKAKVDSILRNSYMNHLEKSAAAKTERTWKKQEAFYDKAAAKDRGTRQPIVERRKQYASEARKLAEQYTAPRSLATLQGGDESSAVKQTVERWLKGESVGGNKYVDVNSNSIEYLERLLKASGYVKKDVS